MSDVDYNGQDDSEQYLATAPRRYRKKPVVIEAMGPLTAENMKAVSTWCGGTAGSTGLRVATLEGEMIAFIGDYVICGVAGEFYPCKPQIFEATYELVGDEDEPYEPDEVDVDTDWMRDMAIVDPA